MVKWLQLKWKTYERGNDSGASLWAIEELYYMRWCGGAILVAAVVVVVESLDFELRENGNWC